MNFAFVRTRRELETDQPLESSNETASGSQNQVSLSANSRDSLNSMSGIFQTTVPPDVVQWHQLFLQMPIAKVIAGIFAALAIANTAHHVSFFNTVLLVSSWLLFSFENPVSPPTFYISPALSAFTRLHVPERAALDHPHPVHRPGLRARHVPRTGVLRHELLRHLRLFRRYSILV